MGMFLHNHLVKQMEKEKKETGKPAVKKEPPKRNVKKG